MPAGTCRRNEVFKGFSIGGEHNGGPQALDCALEQFDLSTVLKVLCGFNSSLAVPRRNDRICSRGVQIKRGKPACLEFAKASPTWVRPHQQLQANAFRPVGI
jgi:hypothetical protein